MKHSRTRNDCKGTTTQGKRCRAAAMEGGLCFFHANPDKAAELGRIGGRSKRPVLSERMDSLDPLPALDNAKAVRDMVNRLVREVYSDRLNPRIATGLASLLQLQLRAIQVTELEQRLCDLEKANAMTSKQLRGRTDDIVSA